MSNFLERIKRKQNLSKTAIDEFITSPYNATTFLGNRKAS